MVKSESSRTLIIKKNDYYECIINNVSKRIFFYEIKHYLEGKYKKRSKVFFASLTKKEAKQAIEKILQDYVQDFI